MLIQNGNNIAIKITSGVFPQMSLTAGVNMLTLPFDIEFMNPADKDLVCFDFKLDKALAQHGLILLGAYEENGVLSVGLLNSNGDGATFPLKEKQNLLHATALEKVALKEVKDFEISQPKPRPVKRAKKSS